MSRARLSKLGQRIFAATGLAALARNALVRDGRFVLTFHGVAGRRYPGLAETLQPSFTASGLDDALTWLGSRFEFLSPERLLAGAAETKRPGLLLTFDDGYANNRDHALPVLRRHRAPAVFFVTTQHVLDPKDWLPSIRRSISDHDLDDASMTEEMAHDLFDGMSREALRECADDELITIGGHSEGHPFLTQLDDAELARELNESKRTLEEIIGREVDLLAYPTGDYDHRVLRAVETAGYRAAFAEESKSIGPARFEIPRVGLYRAQAPYLAAKTSGLHRPAIREAIR